MPKRGPSTIEDRLHRIEGQIRGIERLVESESDTEKIVIQLQAVISSLESVKLQLVKDEVRRKLLEDLDRTVDLLK